MGVSLFSRAALLLAGLISVQRAASQLTKPLISPAIPPLDGGLWDHLAPTQSTHDQWEWGWIPDRCHDEAINNGFSPYDMEVFNIHYTDCGDVWIMCRHHDAPPSQINMIDIFGRMPVRARQYIRLVIAFPGPRHAYTWSDLGDVVLFGDAQNYPTLWAHEMGHALDHNVGGINQDFSGSQTWINAYNQDTAISDGYAATNQAENFAQESVISLFDRVVPGGIGTVEPNWSAIFHQYSTAQAYLGNAINPGATCEHRVPNAGIVCMGTAAPCGSAKARVAKPVIALDNSVPKLPIPLVLAEHPVNCTFDGQFH